MKTKQIVAAKFDVSFSCGESYTAIDEPLQDFYYYVKNAQGDIIGITDCNGNLVASYTYDPWGKVISVSGSNLEIANLNPFRYRGYYYDTDTKLYYLQSRYYDPEVGRFINCDDVNYIGITESEISYNPFAYCENEWINGSDPSGYKKAVNYSDSYRFLKLNASLKTIVNAAKAIIENHRLNPGKGKSVSYLIDPRLGPKPVNPPFKNPNKPFYVYYPLYGYVGYSNKNNKYVLTYQTHYSIKHQKQVRPYFMCMDTEEWLLYIANKHKSLILSLKSKIVQKLGLDSDEWKDFSNALSHVEFDSASKVGMGYNYYSIIMFVLELKEKYLDKEDRYILKIIDPLIDENRKVLTYKNVLILLDVHYYDWWKTYSPRKGFYNYWHDDGKPKYPYK